MRRPRHADVFARTVDRAIAHGITTATFHIQTPYPGTRLFGRMEEEGRITTRNRDRYDTRHVVYRPTHLAPDALEDGYALHQAADQSYLDFGVRRWKSPQVRNGSSLRKNPTKSCAA